MKIYTRNYRARTIELMTFAALGATALAALLPKDVPVAANAEDLKMARPEPKAQISASVAGKSDCSLLTVESLKHAPASGLTERERSYIDRCVGKAQMTILFGPK